MEKQSIKLALSGPNGSCKLFYALQLAYGVTGHWENVIIIGSSPFDNHYQHLGSYGTLTLPAEAPPHRYTELLSLCAESRKQVVIFSNLSSEWEYGVCPHKGSAYYEEVLRSHRSFLKALRSSPLHVICCLELRKTFFAKDGTGRRRLNFSEQVVQQYGIEAEFTTVLQLNKAGLATVKQDETGIFDREHPVTLNVLHGCVLSDWLNRDQSEASLEIQEKIKGCQTVDALYRLLFALDVDDAEVIAAFTRRRLELDSELGSDKPSLLPIEGGLK